MNVGPQKGSAKPTAKLPWRLIAGGGFADLADWLDYVAIVALLTFVWDGGPWVLAWFAVALGAPHFLVGPIAGVLVDRLPLKRVLIATNLGRAVFTAAMIIAPGPVTLLVFLAFRTSVDSAFTPARQAAIQALAAPDRLNAVNAYAHGLNQLTKIAGPALSGALLSVMSAQAVFGINALLSLIAAAIFATLSLDRRAEPEQGSARLFAGLSEGWTTIRGNRLLALAIGYVAVGFFAIFLYDTFIALYLEGLGFSPEFFGLTVSMVGIGGVLAAGILSRLKLDSSGALRLMGVAGLANGALAIGLWALGTFAGLAGHALLLAMFFAFGLAMGFSQVPYRLVIQSETAPDRIGRVTALGEAVTVVALLTAPFAGGLLIAAFGNAAPFLAGGGLTLLAAAFVLLAMRRQG